MNYLPAFCDIFSIFDASRLGNEKYLSLSFIVWMMIFGVILSFIVIYYNKRIVGAFVRALLKENASDEQSAKTLSEIGQETNASAVSRLRSSYSFRRLIGICGYDNASGKRPVITDNTRFYISGENALRAGKMYDDSGINVLIIVLATVGLIAVGVIVSYITLS